MCGRVVVCMRVCVQRAAVTFFSVQKMAATARGKRKGEEGDQDGAKMARVANVPIELLPVDEHSIPDLFKCSICLHVLEQPVEIVVDGCHHLYCRSCLDATIQKECPQCRRPYQSLEIAARSLPTIHKNSSSLRVYLLAYLFFFFVLFP